MTFYSESLILELSFSHLLNKGVAFHGIRLEAMAKENLCLSGHKEGWVPVGLIFKTHIHSSLALVGVCVN